MSKGTQSPSGTQSAHGGNASPDGGSPETHGSGPSLALSLLPIVLLLGALIAIIIVQGPDAINSYSPVALLSAAAVSLCCAAAGGHLRVSRLRGGLVTAARQILPAVPLLTLIALVATTWMLSGLVPTLIDYGLACINRQFFLVIACLVCAFVSVLTGSSWTTIATMGVAFMGIGEAMGYSAGWVAGAIISGAYFGDKISPLSDTTVLASSSCGVDLFTHMRYLLVTTIPSMAVALGVFTVAGLCAGTHQAGIDDRLPGLLHSTFNITPWLLVIPVVTLTLIALRVRTLVVLAISAAMGLAAMFIFQPQIIAAVDVPTALWTDTVFNTPDAAFNDLVSTSGFLGMLPTIQLVLCAMLFGGALMGTGMLRTISQAFVKRLKRRTSIVGATVSSGLFLNCCTADQYVSLIVGANVYRDVYQRFSLEPRLLSRTLEDSISVTSVLIPWNSCGVTQAAVLGVGTLTYLPYCVFNYISPLMSMAIVATGYRIRRTVAAVG